MNNMFVYISLFILALGLNAQAGGYIFADGKSWVRGMEMNPNQTWTAISGDSAKALFDFLNTDNSATQQIEGKALKCEKLATGYWCHMYVNRDGSIQKNSMP